MGVVLLLCLALYADRPLTLSLDPGVTMTAPDAERPAADQSREDLALAARYAPILHFDREEPFLPSFAGYTIFRQDADSASFPRRVTLRPRFPRIDERDAREIAGLFPDGRLPEVPDITAAVVIEYAIWWDWDIQHLYELEHAWSYVGADGELLYAASRGRPAPLRRARRAGPPQGARRQPGFPMLWGARHPQRDGHPRGPLLAARRARLRPRPGIFTANDRVRADTRRACS